MDINSIITKEEFENIKELNYSTFNTYLIRLIKLCVEESLKSIPSIMTHLTSQISYLKGLSDDFYKNNKDLDTDSNRKIMAQAIETIESENPGKSYTEILKLAAPKARKIISKVNQVPEPKKVELKQFESRLGKL